MGFSPLIYALKDLYREKTRAALTDVKISANEIAPYSTEEIEGSRACHTARHEAANGGSERSIDGPDHRPARPVRLCITASSGTSIHSLSTRTRQWRSRGQGSSCSCSPPDQDNNSNHAG